MLGKRVVLLKIIIDILEDVERKLEDIKKEEQESPKEITGLKMENKEQDHLVIQREKVPHQHMLDLKIQKSLLMVLMDPVLELDFKIMKNLPEILGKIMLIAREEGNKFLTLG